MSMKELLNSPSPSYGYDIRAVAADEKPQRPEESKSDVMRRLRRLKTSVRRNQPVLYFDGSESMTAKVERVMGSRLLLEVRRLGRVLVDMLDVFPTERSGYKWLAFPPDYQKVHSSTNTHDTHAAEKKQEQDEDGGAEDSDDSDDGDEEYEENEDEEYEEVSGLKILVDENAHKQVHKMYKEYVSDSDYSLFSDFLKDLDNLLYRYAISDDEEPGKQAKDNGQSEDEDEDTGDLEDEVESSSYNTNDEYEDDMSDQDIYGDEVETDQPSYRVDEQGRKKKVKSTTQNLINIRNKKENSGISSNHEASGAIHELKKEAVRQGFRNIIEPPSDRNSEVLMSIHKDADKSQIYMYVYENDRTNKKYTLELHHTKKGGEKPRLTKRPKRWHFNTPRSLLEQGREILQNIASWR